MIAKRSPQFSEHVAQYINQAVNTTFEQILALSTRNHRIQADHQITRLEATSGVIDVVEEAYRGVLAVTFPNQTITEMMANFYGSEVSQAQVEDGACEIANVIYGQLKTRMNAEGYNLQPARPRLLRGDDYALVGTPLFALNLEFSTPRGKFRVCFTLDGRIQRGPEVA